MGLDITAYQRVEPFPGDVPEKDANECYPDDWWDTASEAGLVHAFVYEGFERSLRGLVADGWYTTGGETRRFRAGSYGGYSDWRRALCDAALGVDPRMVWDDPDEYADRPFFELINFADNEDTIGPDACADLARDFADQRGHVLPKWDPASPAQAFYREKYDEWQQAFELAAGTGLVEFH